jgi:transposase-like protein
MKRGKEKQGGARRKTHPLELKLQVLQQLNAGTGVGDVCRAFGLALTTVALWRKAYAEGGYEALFPKTPGPAKVIRTAPDPRR